MESNIISKREFYPLVKKDINKNLIIWTIGVRPEDGLVTTIYGRLGGSKVTSSYYPVSKNIGKSNETSPEEQGVLEAVSKWKGKLNEGYLSVGKLEFNDASPYRPVDMNLVVDYGKIKAIVPDDLSSGNDVLLPMKAQHFVVGKMKYPLIGQFKLNGLRGALRWEDDYDTGDLFQCPNKSILRTKENNIYDMGFDAPKELFEDGLVYDGELYAHNTPLNIIKSSAPMLRQDGVYCRNSRPKDELNFIIFDLSIPNVSQIHRIHMLNRNHYSYMPSFSMNIIKFSDIAPSDLPKLGLLIVEYISNRIGKLKILPSFYIDSDEDAVRFLDWSLSLGFEGAIFRDMEATYEFGRRPRTMRKAKKFTDKEFIILDIKETTKTSVRSNILFICKNDVNDATFEAVPMGNEAQRQEYLHNKEQYIGQLATVKFYERSGVIDAPFHGNVVTVRNYE